MVHIDNPDHTLQTLRYGPDQIIVNPFDELVWLAAFESGGTSGITDCCLVAEPCNYHRAIADGDSPFPWIPTLEWVQHWPGVKARFDWTVVA